VVAAETDNMHMMMESDQLLYRTRSSIVAPGRNQEHITVSRFCGNESESPWSPRRVDVSFDGTRW